MKNLKNKKLWSAFFAILLIGMIMFIPAEAATPVMSSSTMGGAYAIGSCAYDSSSATATTTHNVTSIKTVTVRGTYRIGDSIKYVSSSSGSITTSPATATVNLPSGASHFMGARGTHAVYYNDMTWGPVYSSIGEQ